MYVRLDLCFRMSAPNSKTSACTIITTQSSVSIQPKEAQVRLGDAENFVILAKDQITSQGPPPIISSNIAASSFYPSEGPAEINHDQAFHLSGRGEPYETDAFSHMEAAYTDAARSLRPIPRGSIQSNLGADREGINLELTPGVYTFDSSVEIKGDIYFRGSGLESGEGNTDVFIIQIAGCLFQTSGCAVILTNGALAKNLFWQVEYDAFCVWRCSYGGHHFGKATC